MDDVCSAARYLVQKGLVDGSKLCVRGGSAGGYIVLHCSLRPSLFAAGWPFIIDHLAFYISY